MREALKHSYINPVHNRPSPDPFVLKHRNEYWCYVTGFCQDGRCFGVLHSRDLVNWRELGGAMERLNDQATCYWAPEVIYDNGRFLMYYSVGNEEFMQVRVAMADHPAGPFLDANRTLTTEQFAIDPHIFRDDDGKWYLFYATDFLEHTHIGTGTVCDEMLDEFTLAGAPRPVTRARYDWQVYDPQRAEKGGVRWHTVEGPFVLKRKGKYYQMFSGGNWKNKTYGASYALSDRILRDDEWDQLADGERIMPILRTIPGVVIGPGHNSAVQGPNLVETYCVYHRWARDDSDRVLAIDRMDWAGERLFVLGPSTTRQPAPYPPSLQDHFDIPSATDLGPLWHCSGGKWTARDGTAMQEVIGDIAEARCLWNGPYFIAEVSARLLPHTPAQGAFGVALHEFERTSMRLLLLPESGEFVVEWQAARQGEGDRVQLRFALPEHFAFHAFHQFRLEVNGSVVRFALDERRIEWEGRAEVPPQSLSLSTEGAAAEFAGFSLTQGWQDLFTGSYTSPFTVNWDVDPTDATWEVREQQLWHTSATKVGSVLSKGPLPEDYELVVNARLHSEGGAEKCYGFLPAMDAQDPGPLVTVEPEARGWMLRYEWGERSGHYSLADDFDPYVYQQFRFRKQGRQLTLQHEGRPLGVIDVQSEPIRIGLYSSEVVAAFDMILVTAV